MIGTDIKMPPTTNPICVWDFTIPQKLKDGDPYWQVHELISVLKSIAKKWVFQLEEGEKTGFRHFQGKCSLKAKKRLSELCSLVSEAVSFKGVHFSPTFKDNVHDFSYVSKLNTRIDGFGPWSNANPSVVEKGIPRQLIEKEDLMPWHKKLLRLLFMYDERIIHYVVDLVGSTGKSWISTWLEYHGITVSIPPMNNYLEISKYVESKPKSMSYLFDFPRALGKTNLNEFFSGVEDIKSGKSFDPRYEAKNSIFTHPAICIFSNDLPEFDYLTDNRWVLWMIKDGDLVSYDYTTIDKPNELYQEMRKKKGESPKAYNTRKKAYYEELNRDKTVRILRNNKNKVEGVFERMAQQEEHRKEVVNGKISKKIIPSHVLYGPKGVKGLEGITWSTKEKLSNTTKNNSVLEDRSDDEIEPEKKPAQLAQNNHIDDEGWIEQTLESDDEIKPAQLAQLEPEKKPEQPAQLEQPAQTKGPEIQLNKQSTPSPSKLDMKKQLIARLKAQNR